MRSQRAGRVTRVPSGLRRSGTLGHAIRSGMLSGRSFRKSLLVGCGSAWAERPLTRVIQYVARLLPTSLSRHRVGEVKRGRDLRHQYRLVVRENGAGVVCIWMPIPPTLPVGVISPSLDVVDGKITGCEPSDVNSGVSDRIGIAFSVKGCGEQSRFVRIWVEPSSLTRFRTSVMSGRNQR